MPYKSFMAVWLAFSCGCMTVEGGQARQAHAITCEVFSCAEDVMYSPLAIESCLMKGRNLCDRAGLTTYNCGANLQDITNGETYAQQCVRH